MDIFRTRRNGKISAEIFRKGSVRTTISRGSSAVRELDERTIANMEVALEKVCRRFPNGGDHASR
jgi:hypothetical protein